MGRALVTLQTFHVMPGTVDFIRTGTNLKIMSWRDSVTTDDVEVAHCELSLVASQVAEDSNSRGLADRMQG